MNELILDGDVRGRFIVEDIQQYAIERGYREDDEFVVSADDEFCWEFADEAIDWLNEQEKGDNYYFWHEGSLFYGQNI